jgi:hypothetical protein
MRGKDGLPALPLVAPIGAATWPASSGAASPLVSPAGVIGGFYPSWNPWTGSRVRARARRACQLGTRPSHPRARPRHEPVGAVRSEAEGKRDEDEGGSETDKRAPLDSECEEKEKRWRFVGMRLLRGLGRLVRGKVRFRPMLEVNTL